MTKRILVGLVQNEAGQLEAVCNVPPDQAVHMLNQLTEEMRRQWYAAGDKAGNRVTVVSAPLPHGG